MLKTIPRHPFQRDEKDTIAYVGRDHIQYRCCKTKEVYEVGVKPKSREIRKLEDYEKSYEDYL